MSDLCDEYWEKRMADRKTKLEQEERDKYKSPANPRGEPTGPYTGRCSKCGSNDLWDDATMYGCNNCSAMYRN